MTLREKVRLAIDQLGDPKMNPTEVARQMGGVADTFVRDILNGKKRSVHGSNLKKLARVLKKSPDWFLRDDNEPGEAVGAELELLELIEIPMRGSVAAGVFVEGPNIEGGLEKIPLEKVKIAPIEGYAQKDLYGLRVRGRSFDLEYAPDETILIIAPASREDALDGDHVIVKRCKASLTELTVREFVREAPHVFRLHARSTDPAYNQSWGVIDDAAASIDPNAAEIIGVVVSSIRRRLRARPMKG